MIATLALCLILTGCGDSTPAAPEKAPAPAAAEPEAPGAAVAEAPAPAAELTAAELAVVVARVNDKDITEADIQKVLGMFKKQMGSRIPADQMNEALPKIRERIVEELVMRRIMLDEVARQGISLSDSEFDKIKADLAQELPPGTSIETYMAETGTTEAEMREQIAVRKMILAQADALEKPSDEEIQAFYDKNKEGFAQGESIAAAHILIKVDPADDEAAKAAKRERIEGLRKQLLDGADFAEVAKANSDCPSASAGGDLGSFGRGQMVPEFEDAAFSQPTGSIGEVVETQFGYHLIKVSEHLDAKTLDYNEVKPRISDILYSQKQQDSVREYVDGLRKNAVVQRFDQAPAAETVLQLDVEDEAAGEVVPAVESAVAEVKEVAAEVVEGAKDMAAEAEVKAADLAADAKEAAGGVVDQVGEAGEEASEAAKDAIPPLP